MIFIKYHVLILISTLFGKFTTGNMKTDSKFDHINSHQLRRLIDISDSKSSKPTMKSNGQFTESYNIPIERYLTAASQRNNVRPMWTDNLYSLTTTSSNSTLPEKSIGNVNVGPVQFPSLNLPNQILSFANAHRESRSMQDIKPNTSNIPRSNTIYLNNFNPTARPVEQWAIPGNQISPYFQRFSSSTAGAGPPVSNNGVNLSSNIGTSEVLPVVQSISFGIPPQTYSSQAQFFGINPNGINYTFSPQYNNFNNVPTNNGVNVQDVNSVLTTTQQYPSTLFSNNILNYSSTQENNGLPIILVRNVSSLPAVPTGIPPTGSLTNYNPLFTISNIPVLQSNVTPQSALRYTNNQNQFPSNQNNIYMSSNTSPIPQVQQNASSQQYNTLSQNNSYSTISSFLLLSLLPNVSSSANMQLQSLGQSAQAFMESMANIQKQNQPCANTISSFSTTTDRPNSQFSPNTGTVPSLNLSTNSQFQSSYEIQFANSQPFIQMPGQVNNLIDIQPSINAVIPGNSVPSANPPDLINPLLPINIYIQPNNPSENRQSPIPNVMYGTLIQGYISNPPTMSNQLNRSPANNGYTTGSLIPTGPTVPNIIAPVSRVTSVPIIDNFVYRTPTEFNNTIQANNVQATFQGYIYNRPSSNNSFSIPTPIRNVRNHHIPRDNNFQTNFYNRNQNNNVKRESDLSHSREPFSRTSAVGYEWYKK